LHNPYNAPTADLTNAGDAATYDPVIFSLRGRIGRVRYIAYTCLLSFGALVAANILVVLLRTTSTSYLFLSLAYLPVFALMIAMGVRRLHDMGHSGWWSILNLIPVLNLFVWMWLALARGDAGANRYGPPPSANGVGVVIAASIITPIMALTVLGIVAAVVIPAYKTYMEKAKAAQQQAAPSRPAQQATP
jgi:uncharacterized membrane protein YhaH (DUF805 family)